MVGFNKKKNKEEQPPLTSQGSTKRPMAEFNYADEGIETIAPNLAKLSKDIDRVLDDIDFDADEMYEDETTICLQNSEDSDGSSYDGDSWDIEEQAQAEKHGYYDSFSLKRRCGRSFLSNISCANKRLVMSTGLLVVVSSLVGTILWFSGVFSQSQGSSVAGLNDGSADKDPRTLAIKSIVSQISTQHNLSDPVSPQFKALNWLIATDPLKLGPDNADRLSQRYTLATMYYALNGIEWLDSESWLSELPECQWSGVICSDAGFVTELSLHKRGLTGQLPDEISVFSKLSSLSLYGNNISGHIPASLYDISSLQHLNISKNSLLGGISPNIGQLNNLTALVLKHNSITSYIPDDIGKLIKVEKIELQGNQLTGALPKTVRELQSLKIFSLYENELDGWLPSELFEIQSLEILDLTSNHIGGVLSPKIADLSNLQKFFLTGNDIGGSIPEEFGDLTSLQVFDAKENYFSGTIPNSLWKMENLQELILQKNELKGALPDSLFDLYRLKTLSLSENKLEGTLSNRFGDLSSLEALYLWDNRFSGTIPSSLGKLSSLDHLELNGNDDLEGDMPVQICGLELTTLYSDCSSGGPIQCDCCTYCF